MFQQEEILLRFIYNFVIINFWNNNTFDEINSNNFLKRKRLFKLIISNVTVKI